MRTIVVALCCVVALVAFVFLAGLTASEQGEVVELTTYDASGIPQRTRVWVVDQRGVEWLRAGKRGNGWLVRLMEQPRVEMARRGRTQTYRALAVDTPEAREHVNQLMLNKYGWADRFIGLMRSSEDTVAVRLEPPATAVAGDVRRPSAR